MNRFTLYRIKNRMLLANFISNMIGVCLVEYAVFTADIPFPAEIVAASRKIDMVFIPFAFLLVAALTLFYERPIRKYLALSFGKLPVSEEETLKARRRLLNEPFVLIGFDFAMWACAAVLYGLFLKSRGADPSFVNRLFIGNLLTGLITVTVAFFVFEFLLQKTLAPYFFPNGGLAVTPGTIRIRIVFRLIALFFACNLIPFLAIHYIVEDPVHSGYDPYWALEHMSSSVNINALVFVATGIWLTFLVSSNLTRPIAEITQVLREVRKGQFGKRVRVTSNDELGYAGDVINEMTDGLRERDQLRQSLALAMEVQQNLLPRKVPQVQGLDIFGASIYCDETGGDYYDFFHMGQSAQVGIVVGDVADHGIPSALLMTTARGFLRLRSSQTGSIARIVTDVNRQLARDLEGTGRFMTLFYLLIDPEKRELEWVRAGHDPALFYDPASETFEELRGSGMALGVDEDCRYTSDTRSGLEKGQIILLGTDGIWETHSLQGEAFGKQRTRDIIRRHRDDCARDILEAIIAELKAFRGTSRLEDDLTMVVIRIAS